MTETVITGTPAAALSTSVTPDLTVIDGVIYTTSLQVAAHFGKAHNLVMRAIRNIIAMMAGEHLCNFALTFQNVPGPNGATRQEPMYRITRYGFSLLAMGFTGKEAFQWKLTFLDTFERMESELVKLTAPALPNVITPAQAQHLRELVQLVVESGKQGHGETWNRLHRKMKVNSYTALRPDQFDAACEYLRGKFDGESIASLIQKHIPALPAPNKPENKQMSLDVKTLCAMIHGGLIDNRAFMEIAYAVNQHQFALACSNTRRGYGQEVADKIKTGLTDADLHAITVAATMETWMRTAQPKQVAA